MFSSFFSIIGALILLCILVFFHELGHYSAGRFFGFGIREFAIGFGPKLWSKVGKDEIRYSLRLLPLGGFCAFYGEDEVPDDDPKSFNNKAAWKRFLLQLAGPFMNILIALLLALITVNAYGADVPEIKAIVADSAAEKAGLNAGDIIYSIDGKKVNYFNTTTTIDEVKKPELEMQVTRDGQIVSVIIERELLEGGQFGLIGIQWGRGIMKLPFLKSFAAAGQQTFGFVREIVSALASVFSQPERIATDFSGPIGTVTIIGESMTYGFHTILLMSCLLSVNLGIFNLLPFPGLDGGRMIFSAIEMIIRRPVSKKIEGAVHATGFMILMAFIIFLTIGDLGRIIGGA